MTDIGTLLTNAIPELPDQSDRVRQVQRRVGRRRAVLGVSAAVLVVAAGSSLVPMLTAPPGGRSDVAAAATPLCVRHLRDHDYQERPFTPDIPSGAIRATLCAQYPTPFKARPDLNPVELGYLTPEAKRLLNEQEQAEARGQVLTDPDGIIAKLNTMQPAPKGCSADFDGVRNWIALEYSEGPPVAVMLDYSCTFTNDSQSRKLTMPLAELIG